MQPEALFDGYDPQRKLFSLWAEWVQRADKLSILHETRVPHLSIMAEVMSRGAADEAPIKYLPAASIPDFRPILVELFMSGDENSRGLSSYNMECHQAVCAKYLRKGADTRFQPWESDSVLAHALYPERYPVEAREHFRSKLVQTYEMLDAFWKTRTWELDKQHAT